MREFDRPATGPDDGLLRIERCGICGSDVEQFKGELGSAKLPHTFGLAEEQPAVEVLAGEVPGEEAVHVAIDPRL